MNKQELHDEVERLEHALKTYYEMATEKPNGMEWYENRPEHEMLAQARREYAVILDRDEIALNELTEGRHMTFEQFKDRCMSHTFNDYNGHGHYATEFEETSLRIFPSDISSGVYRKDFSHVVWHES